MTAEPSLILIRPAAELSLKSRRTRRAFEDRLRRNIAAGLGSVGAPFTLTPAFGRMFLRTEAPELALDVLGRVFGIGSFSPVDAVVARDHDAIVARGAELYAPLVEGRTFAVRAKRLSGPRLSTSEINVALGAELNKGSARVDLGNPEITVRAEIDDDCAYLMARRMPGAGGLPCGIQERVVCLMSGGFDSAVAAWRLLRRGAKVDFVFCNLGGAAYERMVIQVTKALTDRWAYGLAPRFWAVEAGAAVDDLKAKVQPTFWQVVLKRLMYRAGLRVAHATGASALVTGESIGQVSSQTISNLRSIEAVSDLPVLRPLAGHDKQEIIDEARRIGTASLSEKVKEYCAIAPRKPATSSRTAVIDEQEARLDPALLDAAVDGARVIDLNGLSPEDMNTPYLFAHEIPEGAVLIDCQPRAAFDAWHLPGAENRDPVALMEGFERLDKARTYVMYCTYGNQTALLAEVMQQYGFEAYALPGSIAAVRRRFGSG